MSPRALQEEYIVALNRVAQAKRDLFINEGKTRSLKVLLIDEEHRVMTLETMLGIRRRVAPANF